MIPKNKKAQSGFALYLAGGLILGFLLFLMFSQPNIDLDYIGGKQAALIKGIGYGEQKLSFIDVSTKFSAWEALKNQGMQGGFYSDTGDDPNTPQKTFPCKNYVYNLWNNQQQGECWPTKENLEDAFITHFNKYLKTNFLKQDPEQKLSKITYEYKTDFDNHKIIISGIPDTPLAIPISYEKPSSVFEIKVIGPEPFVEDEEITKCCDAECLVSTAKKYLQKYGKSGKNFPYMWGGESPYSYQETKEASEKSTSFFYKTSVTQYKPSPYQQELTMPGFDCSGFVWWVLKHAGIKDFSNRLGADEYESLLIKNKYEEICGEKTSCF